MSRKLELPKNVPQELLEIMKNHSEPEKDSHTVKALKCAYKKMTNPECELGWEEVTDMLCDAICNEIGDNAFCNWSDNGLEINPNQYSV